MEKRDGGWWTGDLGRQKKKLFPANYVEELDPDVSEMDVDNQLGQIQQGAIELQGEGKEGACLQSEVGHLPPTMYLGPIDKFE